MASVTLVLNDVALWIIGGAIAGLVVGRLMRGGGFFVDVLLGIVGAVIANVIVAYFASSIFARYQFWGELVVAVLGAIVLVVLERLVTGRRRATPTA
ncbi:MAG: GlsB/YeaQ/YmgE family stress response membrane protein [Ktedonobacterales bacterium]